MIIDFDKKEDITEIQRLATLRDSVQRALDEQAQINSQLRTLIADLERKVGK